MDLTGSGVGGSGGAKEGRVKEVVVASAGHLVAMEAVDACADAVAGWLEAELSRWREDERRITQEWAKRPKEDKLMVSEEWKKRILDEPRVRPTRNEHL